MKDLIEFVTMNDSNLGFLLTKAKVLPSGKNELILAFEDRGYLAEFERDVARFKLILKTKFPHIKSIHFQLGLEPESSIGEIPETYRKTKTVFKGFAMIYFELIENYHLTLVEALLFGIIESKQKLNDGVCRLSIRSYCDLLQCSQPHYSKAIKKLLALKLIKDKSKKHHPKTKPREYITIFTPDWEITTKPDRST